MAETEIIPVPGQFELPLTADAPVTDADPPLYDEPTTDDAIGAARKTLMAELDSIRQSNQAKFKALADMGARPDATGITMLRLNVLLAMLLDHDTAIVFETKFEREMVAVLNECLAQMRQAQLLTPTNPGRSTVPGQGLYIPPR